MSRCSPLHPEQQADAGGGPQPRAGRIRRALEWVVPGGNPSGVVYGSILTAALLAVESTRRESLPAAAGSVVLSVVVLWLAHSYSTALGDRLHQPAPWTPRHLFDVARDEARLLQGAVVPVVVLLVAAAAGVADRTAVLAALIATIAVLFVLELAAGVASHLGRMALAAQVTISLFLGAAVLLLKVVVH